MVVSAMTAQGPPFAAIGRGVRLSEDRAQAMGAGNERPIGGEGTTASRFATHAGEAGVIYAANNRAFSDR